MLSSAVQRSAQILEGKTFSKIVLESIKEEFQRLPRKTVPRLDILKCNREPATAAYIRHKCKAAQQLGFECHVHEIGTASELFSTAKRLNCDPAVHAIVTQLPVHLDVPLDNSQIYPLVEPWKDVDGLNPINMGLLSMTEASPYFYPCTAAAVMELLEHYGIKVTGKRVCIIGRSAIVGRPLMHMMMRQNATVTVCHSLTKDIPSNVRESEIVVVAVGKAGFLKADWIKPGAVVIDVGINEIISPTGKRTLVGDAEFEGILSVASAVTPVPGGIGPLTVAMLMRNVLRAYELNTATPKIKSV